MNTVKKIFPVLLFIILFTKVALGQSDTIQVKGSSLAEALFQVGNQTGYHFSYDSKIFDTVKEFSVTFYDTDFDKILNHLIGDKYGSYELVDEEQIVILPNRKYSDQPGETPKISISGKIIDLKTKNPVIFANIGVLGTSKGTISNTDGEFKITLSKSHLIDSIVISSLGYEKYKAAISNVYDKKNTVGLQPKYIPIQEVIIRRSDPVKLIKNAIINLEDNYVTHDTQLNSFYREYILKDDELFSLYEAIIESLRKPYSHSLSLDQMKVQKAVRLYETKRSDTVSVKLKAGLRTSLMMDVVRFQPDFFNINNMHNYEYHLEDIIYSPQDDLYKISFEPTAEFFPAYNGNLYINADNYALERAEINLMIESQFFNQQSYIHKQSRNLKTRLTSAHYLINYASFASGYYMNYVRTSVYLKVQRKGRLFATKYKIVSEMNVNQIDTADIKRFKYSERLNTRSIFSDEIKEYENWWNNYNVIKPDKFLRESIREHDFHYEKIP